MEKKGQRIDSFKLIRKGKTRGIEVTHTDQYVDDAQNIMEVIAPKNFYKYEPHRDLTIRIDRLAPHFAAITEWKEFSGPMDLVKAKTVKEVAEQFEVRCVIFKEGKDWQGVMLSGHRKQESGHALNMLTRLVKFEDEADKYPYAEDLQTLCDEIRAEVVEFVKGKHGDPINPTLFTKPSDEPGDGDGDGNGDD